MKVTFLTKCAQVFAVFVGLSTAFVATATSMVTPQTKPQLSHVSEHPNQAIQVTPYLWAAGLNGDISPFKHGPTIGIDQSFSDVLSHLEFGGFMDVWARYDRYVLSGDVIYINTKDSKTVGPLPGGITVKGSVDTKLFIATLLGGYRVLDTPDFTVDALGGARFWNVSNKVKLSTLGLSRHHNESFTWAEPVIGARAFVRLSDNVSAQAQVDLSGLGVAGSSAAWSSLATLNYTFTDQLSVSAGYKVLNVNYDRKGHVYDTRMRGPVVGLTYRF